MNPDAYKILSQRLVEVTAERDRAREIAVALEQQLARVQVLAAKRDVMWPRKFKFGASENYVAGYQSARADLRAALNPEEYA